MSIKSRKKLIKIVRPEHGQTPEKEKAVDDEREMTPPAHREVKHRTVLNDISEHLAPYAKEGEE